MNIFIPICSNMSNIPIIPHEIYAKTTPKTKKFSSSRAVFLENSYNISLTKEWYVKDITDPDNITTLFYSSDIDSSADTSQVRYHKELLDGNLIVIFCFVL